MEEIITISTQNTTAIKKARSDSFKAYQNATHYTLNYQLDSSTADTLDFLGYEAVTSKHPLTDNDLMTYDREQPFNKKIAFQNQYRPKDSVSIPDYYIIPQGQWRVIDLMRKNNIKMELINKDTTFTVTSYRIADYKTATSAYEGHYPHHNVVVEEIVEKVRFRESDILIPTHQPGIRYIIETLEPAAEDSFFKWNFFDTILQQKEGFSSYVFAATAQKMIEENENLKKEFDSIKRANPSFNQSNSQQLNWLYERSPHYEKAHLTYPIYKKNKK
jgi:hypothetical protein